MIEFENEIVIERPLAEVFGFVADFENVPKWNYYVQRVRKTSAGPMGVGTTYHQVRKSDEQAFRVTTYEEGKRVVVETLPGSEPAFTMDFRFEAANDGGETRLLDAWELDTGRPRLLERLAAGQIRRAVRDNLEKLKQLLENGRVTLQDGRVMRLS